MRQTTNTHTSLSDIRNFLADENVAPPPWSSPGTAVESLYRLLEARRGDSVFWSNLKNLSFRLRDARFNANALDRSDVLVGVTLNRLIDDLRYELGIQRPIKTTSFKGLRSSISATALTGLLFLGLATACGSDDSNDNDDNDDNSCEQEAEDYGLSGDDALNYCELVDIINEADLSQSDRSALLECMPDLDGWERSYLLDQFQNASDEEISDILEDILGPCDMCDPDTSDCH